MYWPGFTVYMTYSDISLSMYINHCEMSVELPYLRYIVVLFPQKRFLNYFEGSWVRRLLLALIEGQGLNSCFEGLQRRSDFSLENRTASRSNLRSKSVEKFTLLLVSCDLKSIQKACGILILWMEVGLVFFSLHSKRFQSSYGRLLKVRAGAKKNGSGKGIG